MTQFLYFTWHFGLMHSVEVWDNFLWFEWLVLYYCSRKRRKKRLVLNFVKCLWVFVFIDFSWFTLLIRHYILSNLAIYSFTFKNFFYNILLKRWKQITVGQKHTHHFASYGHSETCLWNIYIYIFCLMVNGISY